MKRLLMILVALALVVGLLGAGAVQYVLQVPFKRAVVELATRRHINAPHVGDTIAVTRGDPIPTSFDPAGPMGDPGPACYDANGRPLAREDAAGPEATCAAAGRTVFAGPGDLPMALAAARAGDVIELSPGEYRFEGSKIRLGTAGTRSAPVIVRASTLGDAKLSFDMLEGFFVDQPYWVFENLDITGVCADDGNCEHAFHIAGGGSNAVIRNNRLHNFNAAVKINRYADQTPDDVLVERNMIFNDRARETAHPVTPIDAVAADRLHIVANVIADFGRNGGDRISYAAFAKGGGSGALFERNLILCEWRNRGGFRVGLSLGGGGTGSGLCRGRRCDFEQKGGTIRDNVIANCSSAGIYLRDATDSRIENNLLRDTTGFESMSAKTSARVANNIIDGHILWRNGATLTRQNNVASLWRAALLMPVTNAVLRRPSRGDLRFASEADAMRRGVAIDGAPRDFCGRRYDGRSPPIGPVDWTVKGCTAPIPGMR